MAVIQQSLDSDKEIAVETREISPSHFLVKIESFSLLSKNNIEMYETTEFEAGGCKWRLIIYPNGEEEGEKNGDYVSVYLAVADSTSRPIPWEINVATFAIFLHNQKSDNFILKRGGATRFDAANQCWGFSKFVSMESLVYPSNGYLVDDNCAFGAEVFVLKSQGAIERLILSKSEKPYKRTWEIPVLSKLPDKWESECFYFRGHTWRLVIYPRRDCNGKGRYISLYLRSVEFKHLFEKVHVSYKVQINNQIDGEHRSLTFSKWFGSSMDWGWSKFISLEEMNDPDKGFLVEDCCIVEIEITVLAEARICS